MVRRKDTRAMSRCAFYQHGWKLYQHGDLEGARDTLLRSVDQDFDYSTAWGLLSRIYESMEEPEHAAEAARQAVRSAPNDPYWLLVAATMLLPLKLYDEALAKVDAALAMAPKDPDAYYMRAIVLTHLKRHDEAFIDLKRALDMDKSLFDMVEHVEEFEPLLARPDFPKYE